MSIIPPTFSQKKRKNDSQKAKSGYSYGHEQAQDINDLSSEEGPERILDEFLQAPHAEILIQNRRSRLYRRTLGRSENIHGQLSVLQTTL